MNAAFTSSFNNNNNLNGSSARMVKSLNNNILSGTNMHMHSEKEEKEEDVHEIDTKVEADDTDSSGEFEIELPGEPKSPKASKSPTDGSSTIGGSGMGLIPAVPKTSSAPTLDTITEAADEGVHANCSAKGLGLVSIREASNEAEAGEAADLTESLHSQEFHEAEGHEAHDTADEGEQPAPEAHDTEVEQPAPEPNTESATDVAAPAAEKAKDTSNLNPDSSNDSSSGTTTANETEVVPFARISVKKIQNGKLGIPLPPNNTMASQLYGGSEHKTASTRSQSGVEVEDVIVADVVAVGAREKGTDKKGTDSSESSYVLSMAEITEKSYDTKKLFGAAGDDKKSNSKSKRKKSSPESSDTDIYQGPLQFEDQDHNYANAVEAEQARREVEAEKQRILKGHSKPMGPEPYVHRYKEAHASSQYEPHSVPARGLNKKKSQSQKSEVQKSVESDAKAEQKSQTATDYYLNVKRSVNSVQNSNPKDKVHPKVEAVGGVKIAENHYYKHNQPAAG